MSGSSPTKRPAFVRDDRDVMGTALSLARRLPPTGRKPAEYSLARGVMAYADRVQDLEEQLEAAERTIHDALYCLEDEATLWTEAFKILSAYREGSSPASSPSKAAGGWCERHGGYLGQRCATCALEVADSAPATHPYPQGYPDHLTADAHDWEPPSEQNQESGHDA